MPIDGYGRDQAGHDAETLVIEVVFELTRRGAEWTDAVAAVRSAAKNLER